ncbi:primosomal replication protein PriB/PriC domain protein [Pseudomonas sp. NPDC078700]|uniref:primosomal replication protein PriB/PriC domain protein n=1 Tax=Pseudomonas sp. NPDC078700 TaxID=3364424 RepID=UPI0037CBE956
MTTAQQMVDKYIEAELAVLDGRTITFGGRTLSMADLKDIREGRLEWERRASAAAGSAAGRNKGYSLATFN